MKKTMFFLVLLLISSLNILDGQDRLPNQRKLMYNGVDSVLFNSTDTNFRGPGSLLIGYHWTNENQISTAIMANQNNVYAQNMMIDSTTPDLRLIQKNAYLMVEGVVNGQNPGVFSHVLGDTGILNARHFSFKPNMLIRSIDTTQYQILARRPYDKSRPIFGFKYINPNALANNIEDSSDANYSYLSVGEQCIGETLFRDPWGIEYLRKHPMKTLNINDSAQKNFYGYTFYISINVKRSGENYTGSLPNAQVLELKLPYTLHDSTKDFIKFEYIPDTNITPIKSAYKEPRGRKTGLISAPGNTTGFFVTADMLPLDDSCTTISAKFRCWGTLPTEDIDPNFRNPRLSSLSGLVLSEIKKLGITAIYRGGCPIKILDVSLTTPQGHKLYEGALDSLICTYLQNDINCVNNYDTLSQKNCHIFRFTDVTEAGVQYFGACRYIRHLLGDVFTGSNGPCFPVLFQHYVQPSDMLLQLFKIPTSVNAPYILRGLGNTKQQYKTMGYVCGRAQGRSHSLLELTTAEQLNSGYETFYPWRIYPDTGYHNYNDFIDSNRTINRIYALKWRTGGDSPFNSFQAFHQFNMWYTFYNDTISGFQYTGKPWYGQIHNLIEWRKHEYRVAKADLDPLLLKTNDTLYFDYETIPGDSIKFNVVTFNGDIRPQTAEETRLLVSEQIAQGAKGLFFDGLSYGTGSVYTRLAADSALKHNPLTNTDYYSYLMNDSLGGDYLDFHGETTKSNKLYFPSFDTLFLNFLKDDVIRNSIFNSSIGCDMNHLYLGRKSCRVELYKLHKYIRANDSLLINFRLMCSYGKGMFRTYNQRPDPILDTSGILMDKFIDKNSIKTRKLWQNIENDSGYVPTAYEQDSSRFYDITLLQKGTVPMDQNFIMTVVNRRTDPLIYDIYGQDTTWSIKFIPAAEFDLLCTGADSLHYREMFWKRFGAREISICMRNPVERPNSEVAFKITELGYDNNSLKKEFWFREPYNHIIDTNLLVGDTLRLRMLPGAMKMLNVQIISPELVVDGQLDYSNQTKLVAYPIESNFNANGTDTIGRVFYHMVYTRKVSPTSNCSNIYYKRSLPTIVSNTEKIEWERYEYQLNDTVMGYICSQPATQYPYYNLPSNYPSIVVRCDSVNGEPIPMVYVVYQASGEVGPCAPKLRIIENVFPANAQTISPSFGRQIADVNARKNNLYSGAGSTVWGIPVINASANGNYYAWNDSLLGIVAGYKTPSQRGYIPIGQKANFKGLTNIGSRAYHPSLNTYSTISDGENDCALVWEESPTGQYLSRGNQIFYTRLRFCNVGGLAHYLPQTWAHDNEWYQRAMYVDFRRIARLDQPDTTNFHYQHLPMIHRDVDFYNANLVTEYNGMWPRLLKADRVYWQTKVGYLDNRQAIMMKFISVGDSNSLNPCYSSSPYNWLVEGTPMILSSTKDLAHPNDAQGKLVKKYKADTLYYSFDHSDNDSVAVLNFVEYPHNADPAYQVPRTADIWQINHGYFSLYYGPFSYDYSQQFPNNTPKAHKIGSKGKYSHLARLPYINNDKTWEYGHRIFESSFDTQGQIPVIKSYDYLLCKKTFEKNENYMFYGFEDTLGYKSFFTQIYLTIDGREKSIIPKFDEKNKIYADTLFSDYFEIGNIQDIDMLQFGSNKKCLNLKLQRKDDKRLFTIQTDKLSDRMDYTKHNVHLLNGKSKQYRFAWIKTKKSNFNVIQILDLPPMNEINKDDMIGKTSIKIDEGYLDLSEDVESEIPEGSIMHIYPNPANEKVLVFFEQDSKSDVNIAIYDLLGNLMRSVYSGELAKGNYQYSVNTKELTSGVYIVRADKRTQTIVKKLIIE